jgi:multicomponent Na+:H+ antiporter subunit A
VIVTLAAFAVIGLVLVAFGGRLHRNAFLVGAVPLAGAAAWAAAQLGAVVDGRPRVEHASWVAGLDLAVDLRLDGLAVTMTLVVAVVGVAVMVYAWRYFEADAPDLGRLAGLLVLFAGSMLGVVQADHVLVLYACWELTSVTSFLLIGNRHTESRARAAALHALLVTAAGGLALLGGLLILAQEAGSFRLSEIARNPPGSSTALSVALVLILVGAMTKSAQYPFHAWLPGAMAAPTPVSAYLHSATMVKAGVFLVARLAPPFAGSPLWRPLIVSVGCATLVMGALRALRQHDLKLLLAFGTVSQLGLLMILFGSGIPEAAIAGWVLLVAHALFKATLFMVVGIIDKQVGTRDVRSLPALGSGWRGVEVITLLALGSMAGVPLGAGFVAKEAAYDVLAGDPFGGSALVLVAAVAGSALTAAYAGRFWWEAFVVPRRRAAAEVASAPAPERPSPALVLPPALLAVAGVVFGTFPAIGDGLASAAQGGFGSRAEDVHLAVWHGLGLPIVLSIVAIVGGAVLVRGDRRVQPLLARGSVVPSGSEAYLGALRGLGRASTWTTSIVQNGSLPVYAGVILLTAAVLPGVSLVVGRSWGGWPAMGGLGELAVAVVLVASALCAASIRKRFAAAVFLGVTGYAMAGLFVLSGAPDLALTQIAVETLSTVAFVLVLRRLPERFERQSSSRRRVVRLVVSFAVAITVFGFALVASGHRLPHPVSDEMVARSLPDGHGRNIVNVILVDFRGFDTLIEITVLAVASIGAVALARVGMRGAAGRGEAPAANVAIPRLPFVDASVRLVFHVVLMTSLWLLFAGHNRPGGGFVGGLLAGSAITLRYIAGGIDEVRSRSRFRPWTVLGTGLIVAIGTATVPLLAGGEVLQVGLASLDLPVIGAVKVSSALAFDAGVYVAVVGMVLMVFESFGDDPSTRVAAEPGTAPGGGRTDGAGAREARA